MHICLGFDDSFDLHMQLDTKNPKAQPGNIN